jgi:phytanoyl-CoA hydroxylase
MTVQGLTPEQLELWDKNGYLIIPDALSPETVQNLLSESHQLLEGITPRPIIKQTPPQSNHSSDFTLEGHPMTKFSTGTGPNSEKHVGDEYFLTSSSAIHFFFEEAAFDASGTLAKPKACAINKIGHALHVLSRPFAEATLTRENRDVAKCLGFRDPRVLQSMVICKQPEIGGAVSSHQDSTFLYTDPPSAVGFWYALEDATEENGALSFAPGSHRRVPVRKRLVRLAGGGTGFEDLSEGKGGGVVEEVRGEKEQEDEKFILGEVKAGSLVLIHGNILHKSERNLSTGSRFIYTFHVSLWGV